MNQRSDRGVGPNLTGRPERHLDASQALGESVLSPGEGVQRVTAIEVGDELDARIEEWSLTLDKYALTERCQRAGVRALPVQSAEDRVERDPQLHARQMYRPMDHPALGTRKVQNAPFRMSETPAVNSLPAPLIGQHTRDIVEGLLGYSHGDLLAGYEDGTFWPAKRPLFPYQEEMLR